MEPVKPLTLLIRPTPDDGWVGGAIYFRNLVQSVLLAAERQNRAVEIVLVHEDRAAPPDSDRILPPALRRVYLSDYDDTELPRAEQEIFKSLAGGEGKRRFRLARKYRKLIEATGGDVIFPMFPIEGHTLPCAVISWIPDLQHAVLPEFFTEKEIGIRDRKYSDAARSSDLIVLSSESARTDFLRAYGEPAADLAVLHFFTLPEDGWFEGEPCEVREAYGIPKDFLMVCNQFWAHKNHLVILRALGILRGRGIRPLIVFTGGLAGDRGGQVIDRFLQETSKAGLWEQCRVLGRLDRKDQIHLMRAARAIVQPSLFEGWSTVMEDARLLGKPVIASDLAVHREQDLAGAVYFPADDAMALADRIAAMLEPSGAVAEPASPDPKAAVTRSAAFGARFLELVQGRVARSSRLETVRPCPVCGKDAQVWIRPLRGKRSGRGWPAWFCRSCFSLSVESGYREDQAALEADLEWNRGMIERNRVLSRGLLSSILALRPGITSVLEIGSGVGTFLGIARDEFGLSVQGYDINAEAVRWGNDALGLSMSAEEWSAASGSDADLVVSLSCLEHVSNPRPLLREMASFARSRGAGVYLSVPFFLPKDWDYLEDGREDDEASPFFDNDVHVTLFSKIGLTDAMAELGLPVVTPVSCQGWSGLLFEAGPSRQPAGDDWIAKWRRHAVAKFRDGSVPRCLADCRRWILSTDGANGKSASPGWLRRLSRRA